MIRFSFIMVKLVDGISQERTHLMIACKRAATLSSAIGQLIKQEQGKTHLDGVWQGICYNDDGLFEGSELFTIGDGKYRVEDEGGVSCL